MKGAWILVVMAVAAPLTAQTGAAPAKSLPVAEAASGTVPAASQAAPRAMASEGSYVIGAEDVLSVVVWKEPELSLSLPVRSDGKISLPLLDDVQAAGLTPSELAARIAERLSRLVQEPRVTVIVTAMNSKKIFLVGQIQHPGAIPLLSEMTALQAISICGGPGQFANTKKIYILRHEGGGQKKYPLNLDAILRGRNQEQNLLLKAGDTIVVP